MFSNTETDYSSISTNFLGSKGIYGFFLDIDEDGRLDILAEMKDPNTGKYYATCIYNNYVKDTFFLKALMVYSDKANSGQVAMGTSYRFVATDLNDKKLVALGVQ